MALEQQIDCFTIQTVSSDYLDGTLSSSLNQEIEKHFNSCKECSSRFKHYRLILTSIAGQPRTPLPAALKKNPLANPLPLTITQGQLFKILFFRWETIPWIVKTIIEGLSIVFILFFGILLAPKLRSLYEKNLEKNLNDFKEPSTIADSAPDSLDVSVPPLQASLTTPMDSSGGDDLAGEDDTGNDEVDVHVGRSQLWRFTLKTVSPDELRPQVVKALREMGIPDSVPGLGGIQVPGGIEFDLVLPQTSVTNIMHTLQKLTPPPLSDKTNSLPGNENFNWYRVKSKKKLPEGTSQVVIWLSQPN